MDREFGVPALAGRASLRFHHRGGSGATLMPSSLQFFAHCGLPGLKKSSDQFTFTTYDHSGKSPEPFSVGNLRLRGKPVSKQPKLINRNVAVLDAPQQVRPYIPRETL